MACDTAVVKSCTICKTSLISWNVIKNFQPCQFCVSWSCWLLICWVMVTSGVNKPCCLEFISFAAELWMYWELSIVELVRLWCGIGVEQWVWAMSKGSPHVLTPLWTVAFQRECEWCNSNYLGWLKITRKIVTMLKKWILMLGEYSESVRSVMNSFSKICGCSFTQRFVLASSGAPSYHSRTRSVFQSQVLLWLIETC